MPMSGESVYPYGRMLCQRTTMMFPAISVDLSQSQPAPMVMGGELTDASRHSFFSHRLSLTKWIVNSRVSVNILSAERLYGGLGISVQP